MSEEKLRNRDFLRSIQRIGTWLPYHSYQTNHTHRKIQQEICHKGSLSKDDFGQSWQGYKNLGLGFEIHTLNNPYFKHSFLSDGYIEPISDLHLKEVRSHYYQVNRKSVFVAIGVCFCVLILVIVFVTLGCLYSGISKPSDNLLILNPYMITTWCMNMIHIRFLAEFCEQSRNQLVSLLIDCLYF